MSEEEPDFETLQRAVAGLRQLVSDLRKTTAPHELLQGIEREIAAMNQRLAPYDYEGPYMQRSLVMRGGFTGTLSMRCRSLTPIGKIIRMRSWIEHALDCRCA
jgi:hypothetical protein